MSTRTAFLKGHGTENDFVIVPDPENTVDLPPAAVAALCDRRAGLGGDGLLHVVRSAAHPEARAMAADAEWFMDYRNGDGSVAEMCGNGIRTYVAYLEHTGLLDLQVGEATTIATRAGTLVVHKEDDGYAVEMGTWTVPGGEPALADGFDVTVGLAGLDEPRPGLRVATPNPHTVIALSDLEELEAVDLSVAPRLEPEPADGSNVEVVVPLGEREVDVVDDDGTVVGTERIGVVRMRVHERGVGETLSCGTGACAAAIATRIWFGDDAPDEWVVLVPGGRLRVRMLEGGAVELAGPAEIVAEVTPLG